MVKFHARTDVGLRRKHNEDSLLASAEYGVFVVADGVGGRKAGELASAITVNTFQKASPNIKAAVESYANNPCQDTRNAVLSLLNSTANLSSKNVYEAAHATGRQGMTSTLVAGVVGGGAAFLVHEGDSRRYLARKNDLRQLTEDHSMINQLIRQGAITPEEAAKSRYRNVITRAVGLYPSVQADTLFVELVEGDQILLCSDGLSDLVAPEEILQHIQRANLTMSVDNLIDLALENGGSDNVTIILVKPEAVLEEQTVAARVRAMENLFLFSDLPFHARLRVGRIVNDLHVSPGEKIVRQGESGDTMYAVIEGAFSVIVDGQEVALMKEGEHFGELSLVDNEPRSADIVAKVPSHVLCVERSALREFCMLEPALGNQIVWKLVSTLGNRLRDTTKRLTEHG